jgi:hypothetical protein
MHAKRRFVLWLVSEDMNFGKFKEWIVVVVGRRAGPPTAAWSSFSKMARTREKAISHY